MDPERFGPYELVRLVGRGGMGEVFEAYDTEQDRTVALKRLIPQVVHDQEFQRRFRRESRLAARLRSPHVVPIHRSGEIEGQLFIDMRLVEGCDLAQVLADEIFLAPPRAVRIVEQLAWALDEAHQAGLIHRDIKPSNVLLDHPAENHEFVYLADFGITRARTSQSVSLTSTHTVLGSLDYMAPEQFDGVVSAEVDIYSLGCLLFQCLTGCKPFPVEGFPAVMHAHLSKPAPLVSRARPELGDRFDEVIARALAKDPAERHPSAGQLAAAAQSALTAAGAPPSNVAHCGDTLIHRDVDEARWRERYPPPSDRSSPPTTALAPPTPPQAPVSRLATPPPPSSSTPSASDAVAAHPEPPTPWWSRRGRLIAVGATVLVLLLGLGVLVGTTVFGGSGGNTIGKLGQGAVALPPPAPTLHSSGTPTVSGTFSVGNGPEAIALSPDGSRAYVTGESGANVLNVVDTAHRSVLATVPAPGPPQFIVMDPSGNRGYVTVWDPTKNENAVAVFDASRNAFTALIPTGEQRPFGLGISPDGAKLYVPNHDSGQITVVDTATATVTAQIPVAPNPHWIAFNPTGRIAYAANHMAGVVTVLDTATNSVIGTIVIGDMVSPHSLAVSPEGRRVEVTNFDGNTVSTIDTATNHVLRTVPVGVNPQSVVFARDGAHSYVVNNASNNLSVLDTETGAVTATIPMGTSPWMAAVSPDGRFAYVTNKETDSVTALEIAQ